MIRINDTVFEALGTAAVEGFAVHVVGDIETGEYFMARDGEFIEYGSKYVEIFRFTSALDMIPQSNDI